MITQEDIRKFEKDAAEYMQQHYPGCGVVCRYDPETGILHATVEPDTPIESVYLEIDIDQPEK